MKDILSDFIRDKSYEQLYSESELQGISALVWSVIHDRQDIPLSTRALFEKSAKSVILSNDRLIFDTAKQVQLFEKNGIGCAVLKGVAVGAYYPSPVIRRAGDIDIYVHDPSEFKEAAQLLADNGFVREEKSYSLHHVGFTGPDGIETELHSMLVEPFDDRHINEMAADFEKNLTYTRVQVRDNLFLPVLSEKDNAAYLVLHLLSHFLGEGMSLRQLIDISVLFNDIQNDKWQGFFRDFMTEAGLKSFATAVCGYCQKHLGLRQNPMSLYMNQYDETMESQIEKAIEGGDFGHHGAEKMAVPSKSLWATFITQVKRQYPDGWKKPVIRPFLCIRVGIGFIRNNRKIRHVSTMSVLKDAKNRGKEAGYLKVFSDDDTFTATASGNSMWPFIEDGDRISISPVSRPPEKYDIVLYSRDNGMLVLHRVIKVSADGYYIAGDNQTELEGPVTMDMIQGILKGFYHNGKYTKASFLRGRLWAALRPLRKAYRGVKNAFKG